MQVRVRCHGGFFRCVFDSRCSSDGERAALPGENSGFTASEGEFVAGGELSSKDFGGAFEELGRASIRILSPGAKGRGGGEKKNTVP